MGRHSAAEEPAEDLSSADIAGAQRLTSPVDTGRHTRAADGGAGPGAPSGELAPVLSLAERVDLSAPMPTAQLGVPLPPLLFADLRTEVVAEPAGAVDRRLDLGDRPRDRADGQRASDERGGSVFTLAELPDELVPQARASRAGRNLPAAIGVGLGLGAMIVASLLVYRPSFVVIVCLAMAYAIFEMTRAIGAAEARPPLVPLVAGGLAMDVAAWYRGANALVIGLLLTVLGVTVWRLAEGAVGYARDVTSAAFIALYVPLLGGFAVLLTHYSDGAGRVITFIATVVCSDVGGYTAGVLFGKHPMAPTVSPKKSWEGFAGSALACSIGGALFMSLLFHHRWWIGVLYGLAIAVTATLGDLGESMVKRDLGVKDMGRLLPGHGGLMDRLDSLLPCAAVAYLIMAAAL